MTRSQSVIEFFTLSKFVTSPSIKSMSFTFFFTSNIVTLCSFFNCAARWEPINPEPPVIMIFKLFLISNKAIKIE